MRCHFDKLKALSTERGANKDNLNLGVSLDLSILCGVDVFSDSFSKRPLSVRQGLRSVSLCSSGTGCMMILVLQILALSSATLSVPTARLLRAWRLALTVPWNFIAKAYFT